MKIRKLTIEKFRAIRSSEIELGQETALVGQNSAGKSSILRALNAFFNFEEERAAFQQGRHAFQKTTTAIITVDFVEVSPDCELPRVSAGGSDICARLKYRKSPQWQVCDRGNWVSAPTDFQEKLSKYIRYVYVPTRRDHEVSGWRTSSLARWLNGSLSHA